MVKIYLDDVRTPTEKGWTVVRNYDEFVEAVNKHGLKNIKVISLDHDLGDEAMTEYYSNVKRNHKLDYSNIRNEKTGMDCCKFLVNKSIDDNEQLPQVFVHSANPIGRDNMMNYINNFLDFNDQPQSCLYNPIPHTLHQSHMVPLEDRLKRWDKFYMPNPKTNEK